MRTIGSWKLRFLTLGLPSLLAGSFEFVRHGLQVFAHLPTVAGNLITAGLALVGALVYFQTAYSLAARLAAEAERAHLEREALMRRQDLADELHDSVSQTLFFLHVRLKEVRRRTRELGVADLADLVEDAASAAEQAYLETRDTIRRLARPGAADRTAANWALARLADSALAGSGLAVAVEACEDEPRLLAPGSRTALYAILLEALRNVRKHAAARHVRLWMNEDAEGGRAGIEDDGRGFLPAEAAGHGLFSARRRAARAGLRLDIDSEPGRGTRFEVLWGTGEGGHAGALQNDDRG